MPTPVFDSAALAETVDLRRRALGRTWAQVTTETGVAISTIRRAGDMEVDGVAFLLQWLGVPFEAFLRPVNDHSTSLSLAQLAPDDSHPPGAPRWHTYRRFDTAALYEALDRERDKRQFTWADIAAQIGNPTISAAALRALRKGGRTSVSKVTPILSWLGEPASAFSTLPATARGQSTIHNRQSTITAPNRES